MPASQRDPLAMDFLDALENDASNAQLIQLALSACAATAAAQKAAADAQRAAAEASAANVRLVQAVVASRSQRDSRCASPKSDRNEQRDTTRDVPPPPPSVVSVSETGSTSGRRAQLSVQAQYEVLVSWMQTLSTMQPPSENRVQLRFLMYPRNSSPMARVLSGMQDAARCKKLVAFAKRLHALVNERLDYPKIQMELQNMHASAGHNVAGARVSSQKTPHFLVHGDTHESVRDNWASFQRAVAKVLSEYTEAGGRDRKRMFARWEA